jgi:nitrogen fixation protein NifB
MSLPAAPRPALLRRDRPFDAAARALDVADVMRYVGTARRTLAGPLVVEIEGPGDPLASPEVVLRALSLLHEHHPDVLTGLVIDGPLLAEYVEELEAFGLRYLVLRLDALRPRTLRRLVDGAWHRGEFLDRAEAATLAAEEGRRALGLARLAGIPLAVRCTLVPTVNARDVAEVARFAAGGGAERLDVVPHAPVPGTPLERAGVPTEAELAEARAGVARAFEEAGPREDDLVSPALRWLSPERMRPVDLDLLEVADVLGILPDPDADDVQGRLLPPRRAQLVAVASADGTLVDLPLGMAHALRVYAVTGDAIRYLGARALSLDARRRHDGVGDAQDFLGAVVGCRAVVATHVPARAATLLRAVGVRPVAAGGLVAAVLDRVARGTLRHVH